VKKKTTGNHFDDGKPPIHLIPSEAITGIAKALDFGAKKYGEYNFRKGIKHTKIIDSLIRHALAYLAGEDFDPESGLSHIQHLGANYAMLEYIRLHHPDLDDRFKNETSVNQVEMLENLNKAKEYLKGRTYATKSKKVKSRSRTPKLCNRRK
jgi:hypothetical protein